MKSSKWKLLADLALVLMTMPLADVHNERVFSLKCDVIGDHGTRHNSELLRAPARIKVHADMK
jgi:hypothetical protein